MARVGDRFKTGQKSPVNGDYNFDGYLDGSAYPAPSSEEKQITLETNETFPPINSADKGCWWKLSRIR